MKQYIILGTIVRTGAIIGAKAHRSQSHADFAVILLSKPPQICSGIPSFPQCSFPLSAVRLKVYLCSLPYTMIASSRGEARSELSLVYVRCRDHSRHERVTVMGKRWCGVAFTSMEHDKIRGRGYKGTKCPHVLFILLCQYPILLFSLSVASYQSLLHLLSANFLDIQNLAQDDFHIHLSPHTIPHLPPLLTNDRFAIPIHPTIFSLPP
jgi:hypothetical protein